MERFRMLPPLVDDFDTTTVRIEESRMQELGIHNGDTVKIRGMQSSGAVCLAVKDHFKMPNDSEITYLYDPPVILPTVRAGSFVVQNVNLHGSGLIPVSIEKVHDGTRPAHKVCLMSLDSCSENEQFEKSRLDTLIVCRNNRLHFRSHDRRNNFGYMVTRVEPADYSQIIRDTVIEFVKTDPDTIHASFHNEKLQKMQNVIPIAYQKTLNDVDVIIPSLEIFDTGIRFYVYAESNFEQHKIIPNGSASIVVTLNDNLGNSYILDSHGGGGSHSPNGFDYKYEFRGRQLHPDAERLTITLHEIIIQELFPREGRSSSLRRRPMKGTKDEYASIDKFPSFFIIPGPWQAVFPVNDRRDDRVLTPQ